MVSSVQSPTDIVNQALVRIGRKWRVGSLYDGSEAAKLSLDIYGQTRDDQLRLLNPDFALRETSPALLKSAPVAGYFPPTIWTTAYPPLPWLFQYAYPSDAVEVRAVRAAPLFLPVFDPQPEPFGIANDATTVPPTKMILCNVANAVVTYTARITDPATWEPSFAEALISALARRLAAPLAGLQIEQAEATDEQAEAAVADARQG